MRLLRRRTVEGIVFGRVLPLLIERLGRRCIGRRRFHDVLMMKESCVVYP